MNNPAAYSHEPVAVLWADHTWTPEAFARRVHPGNGLPPVVTPFFPLLPSPYRPCGHDGCTISRKALPC